MHYYYGFEIRDGTDGLTKNNLVHLWHSVGWIEGSAQVPDRLLDAMKNASTIFTAWDGGHLIGLCSAIDDGLNAWISYMVVDHAFQNRNIGGYLLDQMVRSYSGFRIYVQTNHAAKFYKKHGFSQVMTSLKLDDVSYVEG